MTGKRKESRCRSCQAVCYWVKTTKGADMLVDVVQKVGQLTFAIGGDGVARRTEPGVPGHESHFVSCPQRDQWRRDNKPKAAKK